MYTLLKLTHARTHLEIFIQQPHMHIYTLFKSIHKFKYTYTHVCSQQTREHTYAFSINTHVWTHIHCTSPNTRVHTFILLSQHTLVINLESILLRRTTLERIFSHHKHIQIWVNTQRYTHMHFWSQHTLLINLQKILKKWKNSSQTNKSAEYF